MTENQNHVYFGARRVHSFEVHGRGDAILATFDEIDYLIFSFDKIARFEVNLVFEFGFVLPNFDSLAFKGQLSEGQRNAMLNAVIMAHARAIADLPAAIDRQTINLGMRAVAGRVIAWAETLEERAARHRDVYTDMRCATRILRNELHNFDLRRAMKERKALRRAIIVDTWRKAANDSLPAPGAARRM